MDPSKRSYVNNKLEDDRRKKEKYAVMEKKKRGLVDVSRFPELRETCY